MSTHSSHKDPAAKVVLLVSLLLILATVFVLVSSLFSTISKNSTKGEIDMDTLVANNASMVEAKIKPIGEVTTSDASGAVAAGPARSGEEVYTAVCSACHGTGAAGAPKVDDKAAWAPRVDKGFDALMHTAINGKGAMPARGGQNVPDAELKAAIAYMTTKAGFNLAIPKDEAPAAKAEEPTKDAASTDAKSEAEAETTTDEKKEEAPAANAAPVAPSAPETPKTPETPKAEEASAPVAVATPEVAATPEAVATPEVAAAPVSEEKAAPAISGETIYKSTCFACHGMGVAGSPKLGDKTAWEPRIAKGNDALYTSAIKGVQSSTGVMPPKGGNFSLSDDEVKAAVDYMVTSSK